MDRRQLELTMTTFIMSHFSYYSPVWMFHDRASNNKINKVHERALRTIHKGSTSNFQELLNKSDSVSVHQINLQLLQTEIYKAVVKCLKYLSLCGVSGQAVQLAFVS